MNEPLKTDQHIATIDGVSWAVRTLEYATQVVLLICSKPPAATMPPEARETFLAPIVKPYDGDPRPVLRLNTDTGQFWATPG